jgi:hypothetical protein
MANQTNSLAHTKWMCKYHVVFSVSIDEKSYIVNTKKVRERYSNNCAATRE